MEIPLGSACDVRSMYIRKRVKSNCALVADLYGNGYRAPTLPTVHRRGKRGAPRIGQFHWARYCPMATYVLICSVSVEFFFCPSLLHGVYVRAQLVRETNNLLCYLFSLRHPREFESTTIPKADLVRVTYQYVWYPITT